MLPTTAILYGFVFISVAGLQVNITILRCFPVIVLVENGTSQGRMGNCKVTGILERPAPA